MERNWKSPLLSLTFNFQPNANSIPQLLLRKPRNDYLSSARYYDSSNSRPNVIRIYIYIYLANCSYLILPTIDEQKKEARAVSKLTERSSRASKSSLPINRGSPPPSLPLLLPRKKAILSGCLVTRRDRPLELL